MSNVIITLYIRTGKRLWA